MIAMQPAPRTLVLAEHDNARLAVATRHAASAAIRIGAAVDVIVAGDGAVPVALAAARIPGIGRVLHAEARWLAQPSAENVAATLVDVVRRERYTHVVAAATGFAKGVLPRVAALLDVAQVSDVVAVESSDTFERPIYAGNALATVRSADAIKVLTARTTAFAAAPDAGGSAVVIPVEVAPDIALAKLVGRKLSESTRPELASARVVISGGRALASGDNFALLERLASKLDAAIGASRAAVDAGFVSNDLQVGQTGKIVAPELYIAVGISGAIQHLAGMKDSKVIVAINKDSEAPIFEIADYGLVGDLFDIVPELTDALG
jgi:electron transfer flavoprotein alpha subunit